MPASHDIEAPSPRDVINSWQERAKKTPMMEFEERYGVGKKAYYTGNGSVHCVACARSPTVAPRRKCGMLRHVGAVIVKPWVALSHGDHHGE